MHMACQPDVNSPHRDYRPSPPRFATCELGDKMPAALKRAAVETGGVGSGCRRSSRDRSPAPRADDARLAELPTTDEKPARRKGRVAMTAAAAAREELCRKQKELDTQLRENFRLELLARGHQTQSAAARDSYIQSLEELTQERHAFAEGHYAVVLGDSIDKFPLNRSTNYVEWTLSVRLTLGLANSPLQQYHVLLADIPDTDTGLLRVACLEKERDE